MKTIRTSRLFLLLGLLLSFSGCATQRHARIEEAPDTVRAQDLEGLPYHPLVYHLDLSILAYQLYGQTLVWPYDPYYEESANRKGERARLMENVRAWAKTKGAEQVQRGAGLDGYRGPGVLGGFEDNAGHDPIVFRYDRIHPWSHAVNAGEERWIEYRTPMEITGRIRDVYVGYRKTGREPGGDDAVAVDRVVPRRDDSAPNARDVLLAFEGGTGDKGEPGRPASQSLMGFVLLRYSGDSDDYDVHIAFRGSRSGSASRAARQALKDHKARGNPDWITDLGFNRVEAGTGGGHITRTGEVNRGFARSMESILPQLFRCLSEAAELGPGGAPDRIYVTGHSLGGGLAQHFVSAVLLGKWYGPDGTGDAMPTVLRNWPWEQIKLITFGAPRSGNAEWAETLTTEGLASEFFSTAINPYDKAALAVAAPSIVPRLLDRDRPAGYRVLIPTDPITTQKFVGGKHVGKTVYLRRPRKADLFKLPDFEAHEPWKIRSFMHASLADLRIPETAWLYREPADLNPGRDEAQSGSIEEFVKLSAAIERYYRDNDLWFDHAAFARDFDLFREIFEAE